MFELTTLGLASLVVLMTLTWLWQWHSGNAGWVDVAWSLGMALLALLYAVAGTGAAGQRLLVGVLGGVWALRLAIHLWRRVSGSAEDGRYVDMREWLGGRAQPGFFLFFQFQAVAAVVLALPWLVAVQRPVAAPAWAMALSGVIWLIAVVGETIADRQLSRFRGQAENRGKTCRDGLWRYSRHPNYFFEWLHWWAYVPLTLGGPLGWVGLLGPLMMFLVLYYLTGIPHTERRALASRGADYANYQRSTPMFFPWFPKEISSENRH
jgi:steroid 5-alpha reductase family enzyme